MVFVVVSGFAVLGFQDSDDQVEAEDAADEECEEVDEEGERMEGLHVDVHGVGPVVEGDCPEDLGVGEDEVVARIGMK